MPFEVSGNDQDDPLWRHPVLQTRCIHCIHGTLENYEDTHAANGGDYVVDEAGEQRGGGGGEEGSGVPEAVEVEVLVSSTSAWGGHQLPGLHDTELQGHRWFALLVEVVRQIGE